MKSWFRLQIKKNNPLSKRDPQPKTHPATAFATYTLVS